MIEETAVARWYPNQPPSLPGEDADAYTNRLLGANGNMYPYDHRRRRQCSIGWHNECSDRGNYGAIDKSEGCGCPCHEWKMFAAGRAQAWNDAHPVGTRVTFGQRAADEPDVVTTSAARVEDDLPVVELDTFPRPVSLAWLEAV